MTVLPTLVDGKDPLDTAFYFAFLLYNLREKYPNIQPSVWQSIQQGLPQKGMTLKECRLAMDKPKQQLERNESTSIATWYYDDHLNRHWSVEFKDGKLTQYSSYKFN